MVDYVLLDNENPNKFNKIFKPNYFAKGFEYNANQINKNTLEEEKTVKSYSGKMIFTPGDIIYSSTNLLKYHSHK